MNNLYGSAHSNNISIIIDPISEIYFTINGKKITAEGLRRENLSYKFSKEEMEQVPDGYERLLHDVFVADRTNFTHWSELMQLKMFGKMKIKMLSSLNNIQVVSSVRNQVIIFLKKIASTGFTVNGFTA